MRIQPPLSKLQVVGIAEDDEDPGSCQTHPTNQPMMSLEHVVVVVPDPRKRAQDTDHNQHIGDDTSGDHGRVLLGMVNEDVDDLVEKPAVVQN